MDKMRAVASGLVVAGALVCAALVMAQQQRTAPPRNPLAGLQAVETTRDSHLTGVTVVRLINTAENSYKSAHGSYATWDELLHAGAISALEEPATPFQGLQLSAGPEVVPGWNLAIVVSADRRKYELALRSVDDKQCRFSFFSDESGLIYEGGVIDCPVQLVPAHG
jgi:hypothetical protein